MNVSDYIIEFFENLGVEHIFTVSGGGSIFLCDALARAKTMKYVCCHHEQAAGYAGEAYARLRGLGVTLVTSGPGGTNAVSAVAASWLDHIPHVFISGQAFLKHTIKDHPGLRQMGVQEINIVDIVRPITKYAVMIKDASLISYHLEKALYLARSGRPGPVWIDVPGCVQNAALPADLMGFIPAIWQEPKPDLTQPVAEIKKLLWQSARPLFHIGQGIRIAGAETALFRLLDALQVPFVTARNANDIVASDHPLYVGRPGTFGQRGANFAVQTCDLYIAIGTRLSLTQTGYNSQDYARNAKIIQVDIDEAELNKGTLNTHRAILADAKDFIEELERQWHAPTEWIQWSTWTRWDQWSPWLKQCQAWKEKYPVCLPEYKEQKEYVNSFYFIDVLAGLAQAEEIIVTDMGFAFQNTHQAWKTKKGQNLITNCGLAPMGWGLPAAVGACVGSGRRVILIVGDGGLMMNIQELATVMHHKLPIKIFVLNNGGYLTIKQTQQLGFEGRLMGVNEASGLSFPRFSHIAAAHNIYFNRSMDQQYLSEQLEDTLNHDGPAIREIWMSPDQIQAPRSVNRRNPDGTMNPTRLEDAYPFLPKEEIDEQMTWRRK